MAQTFTLSDEDCAKIDEWMKGISAEVVAKQKADRDLSDTTCGAAESCWEHGVPYFGAIGGGLTYVFTPTTIGTCVTVKYCGRELDLSDF